MQVVRTRCGATATIARAGLESAATKNRYRRFRWGVVARIDPEGNKDVNHTIHLGSESALRAQMTASR